MLLGCEIDGSLAISKLDRCRQSVGVPASGIFAARLDGRDPAEEKKQSRRRLVVDRIDDLVETFIQERVLQTRTARRITNLLRRDVVSYWGKKSIHEIKKRDVIDLVTEVSQRNAHAGYRLLKTLKTFFRWCIGRAVIDFSPAEGVQSNWRETSRDRVLTDPELAAIMLAARKMPWPYEPIPMAACLRSDPLRRASDGRDFARVLL